MHCVVTTPVFLVVVVVVVVVASVVSARVSLVRVCACVQSLSSLTAKNLRSAASLGLASAASESKSADASSIELDAWRPSWVASFSAGDMLAACNAELLARVHSGQVSVREVRALCVSAAACVRACVCVWLYVCGCVCAFRPLWWMIVRRHAPVGH
jgi:hypothetical protein